MRLVIDVDGAPDPAVTRGRVVFSHVRFRYDPEVPLFEDTESYEVDILSGAMVKRTLATKRGEPSMPNG